ncbi:MAG TPA: ankyrin repeat domain-containing protein, partial [Pyrinomonadaceae bacterium]|nr:ankyrin repeat domain-containing protein [Pyrinomonadaceae bacterium]
MKTSTQRLMSAAEAGDEREVEALLDAGADVDAATPGGETALMRAAARGHASVVRALVVSGADVDAARADGWTALMLASFFGHAEAAHTLVAGGADVRAADRKGSDALSWAASRGHVEIARFLRDAAPPVAAPARAHAPTAHAPRPARHAAAPAATRDVTPRDENRDGAHVARVAEPRDDGSRDDRSRADESRAGESSRARRAEAESIEKIFGGADVKAAAPVHVEEAARQSVEAARRSVNVDEEREGVGVVEARADELTKVAERAPSRRRHAYAYAATLAIVVASGGALAYRYAGWRGAPASQVPTQQQP